MVMPEKYDRWSRCRCSAPFPRQEVNKAWHCQHFALVRHTDILVHSRSVEKLSINCRWKNKLISNPAWNDGWGLRTRPMGVPRVMREGDHFTFVLKISRTRRGGGE